ncbi:hypothetical protein ACFWC9_11935 [Streptomyces goshikiensis]|uniref:hypothetical protein n=1 Tax=Streptomyces goshikiensis TaxID=1942 RepID=UPI00369535A0
MHVNRRREHGAPELDRFTVTATPNGDAITWPSYPASTEPTSAPAPPARSAMAAGAGRHRKPRAD